LSSDAVLLDRDGIITEPVLDPHTGSYESPLHPADVRLVDQVGPALRMLRAHRVKLIVVSNQPAAAKGMVPMSELEAVHARTVQLLAHHGVAMDAWHYCHHHPAGVVPELTGRCDCRKPSPGLLLTGLAQSGVEPARAWMVGDSDTDIAAGRAAGTRTALLVHPRTAHRRDLDASAPDLTLSNLQEFVELVINRAQVP
jgi:D-glycero-D-manno-heptose 1,7-bisphosphate phosphatase